MIKATLHDANGMVVPLTTDSFTLGANATLTMRLSSLLPKSRRVECSRERVRATAPNPLPEEVLWAADSPDGRGRNRRLAGVLHGRYWGERPFEN
jgi:hypothetical protein